jgi:hypothetical protein
MGRRAAPQLVGREACKARPPSPRCPRAVHHARPSPPALPRLPPPGAVVGSAAAVALAAGGAVLFRRRARLQRQGWRKDDLGGGYGGNSSDGAFGVMPNTTPMGPMGGGTGYNAARVEMSAPRT